jgi:hypothetical protein
MGDPGWTLDTLYLHIERRFADQQDAVGAALRAAEKATDKADAASEKRFEGVNEFRETLKDQQSTFITRTEVYALVGAAGVVGGIIGHYIR